MGRTRRPRPPTTTFRLASNLSTVKARLSGECRGSLRDAWGRGRSNLCRHWRLLEQIQQRRAGADWARETITAQAGFRRNVEGVVDGGAEVLHADRAVLDVGADAVGFAPQRASL